jgi:plasmid maintenance system antidote protein VapI
LPLWVLSTKSLYLQIIPIGYIFLSALFWCNTNVITFQVNVISLLQISHQYEVNQILSKMNSFGSTIKEYREKWTLPLQTVASYIDVDEEAINRIEHGKQMATRQQVVELAEYFGSDENEFLILWLSDMLSSQAATL